jgi:hypothetical protein
MNMGLKDDSRHFSLVTRRAREVVLKLTSEATYTADEIATIICKEDKDSEFYLKSRNRQISKSRALFFIRFLTNIGVLVKQENGYKLYFLPRTTDEAWAQALSDQSVRYLKRILVAPKKPEIATNKVPELLKSKIKRLLGVNSLPTLENIVDEFPHIDKESQKDFFKWALYLYTDSKNCPLDIYRFPILMGR